jgi:hypothetical protein
MGRLHLTILLRKRMGEPPHGRANGPLPSRSKQRNLMGMSFFRFPDDARWNADTDALEFGVGLGEYEGVVRVARTVFRRLVEGAVSPEKCVETYHLERTWFERAVEAKLHRRELAADGNIDLEPRDLRRARG